MFKPLTLILKIARTYSLLEVTFHVNFKISIFLIRSKNSQILILDSFNLEDILHPQSKFHASIPGGLGEKTKSKTATRNTPNIG